MTASAANRAVFLDRDGVITQEPPHYAHKRSQLKLVPRAAEAIRVLNEHGFKVVVVSNQSGIARGYYGEKDARAFTEALREELGTRGAAVDAAYYCPHHPEAPVAEFRTDCDCRKPRPGMLRRAEKELGIVLDWSFMVGDRLSDIEAGRSAGCRTIIVRTGRGDDEMKDRRIECDCVAADLWEGVEYILSVCRETGRPEAGPGPANSTATDAGRVTRARRAPVTRARPTRRDNGHAR